MSSSRKPLPSQDQTSTQVHSEHQSVHAVATSEHQRGSRPRTRSEHPRTRTRARSEHSRSRRSEVLTTTIGGQPAADTVSQHPRATASSVTGTEVPWVWPEDTNLRTSSKGNLLLTVQSSIVRKTISESFELLQAYLTFKHAFPDSILMNKFIEDALSTAALHVPNAEDVHVRILRDYSYCARMSYLVCVCLLPSTELNRSYSHEPESALFVQRSRSAVSLLLCLCSLCLRPRRRLQSLLSRSKMTLIIFTQGVQVSM